MDKNRACCQGRVWKVHFGHLLVDLCVHAKDTVIYGFLGTICIQKNLLQHAEHCENTSALARRWTKKTL
jgi:hypothetical protein